MSATKDGEKKRSRAHLDPELVGTVRISSDSCYGLSGTAKGGRESERDRSAEGDETRLPRTEKTHEAVEAH